MSTAQEISNSNIRLSQYFNLYQDNHAVRLFSKEFNVNHQYSGSRESKFSGCTALHSAAKHRFTSDIKYLLSRGADPTIENQYGSTPLHTVIRSNCEQLDYFNDTKSYCELLLSAQVKSGNMKNPDDGKGLTHFHIACMANHARAVEFFLKSGISVDKTMSMESSMFPGYTPLHLAASCSALEATKMLLSYGANTQLKNAQGMTFVCTAFQVRTGIIEPFVFLHRGFPHPSVESANLKLMNFLLQSNSYPINFAGLTRFHLACSLAEVSIAQGFLQKITEINHAVDMDAAHWPGYTALHFAACSSVEMVKMLVKNGANILAKNAKGVTPLHMCIKNYKIEDVHAVLSLDPSWKSILLSDRRTRLLSLIFAMKDTKQFDHFLESRPQLVGTRVPLDSPAWQGFTPLRVAVMFYASFYRTDERSEHIIAKLMAKGSNINAQDIRGRTPLHLAYRYKCRYLDEFLLKFHEQLEDVVDDENLSHLHIACRIDDKRAVEKILQTCRDVNVVFQGQLENRGISRGSTPLHIVAANDEIVALLLERGADPYSRDVHSWTAIHRSEGESAAILSLPRLEDFVVEDVGLSHLHIAVRNGNVQAVRTLLDNDADVNRAILEADVLYVSADEDLKNEAGATPLDLALKVKGMEVVELLMRRGAEVLLKEDVEVDLEDTNVLRPLVSTLSHDDSLFVRLEKEIGLTMLHVACSRRDVDLVKALLDSGADVDAQINPKSRLWPGYTALHVVMDDPSQEGSLDEIVRLLLDNGADVTLTANGDSALYLGYQSFSKDSASDRYSCLRMLSKAHRDFTVNQTRYDGLSHFHIACIIGDIVTVEKFLQHGVDVNQPTDFFIRTYRFNRLAAGATPLHLAAASSIMDPVSQLRMVDLLLNHGADVDAQDVHGDTALHLMALWNFKREDIILRLVGSKANPNPRNVSDKTPLEVLISTNKNIMLETFMIKINKDATVDDIKSFVAIGCCFNVFNSETEKGLIAMALSFIPFEKLLFLLTSSVINFPLTVQTDEMGRTVMHNMVSNINGFAHNEPVLSIGHYAALLEALENLDFDVDEQDKLGRTPLHPAVTFRNTEAIIGLLIAGVDVNIADSNGKTAFSYLFDPCVKCLEKESHLLRPRRDHNQYAHVEAFLVFVTHMKKLLLCGLEVSETNEKLMFEAIEKCNIEGMSAIEDFVAEIAELRCLKVANSRLTVGSFLSETSAVVAYSNLPQAERDAVDDFFKYKISDIHSKYTQVASVLLLQYRKAVKRVELNQSAPFALNILSRLSLPDLCSKAILKLLSNSELGCMIEAAG